ncbi:MAG: rod shape-determining protein RodA [Bacteroidia bacterium]|nr:rod shape-determining protein RodA [Bacteroidia bacterium]MCX7651363.1 rod shape-determining protein RodA [Bacteroidia bacterium]MDW8416737.1 FtsW/RodA/SpoVE family cell cycle protein [Bacteroidia bacterium]
MQKVAPDWLLYAIVVLLMGIGILNLYSIEGFAQLSWKYAYTRQLVWAAVSLFIMIFTTLIEGQVWRYFSYGIYAISLAVMLLPVFVGREISGAKAWLDIGPLRLQPSEFMKIATGLALAAYINRYDFRWTHWRDRIAIAALISTPAVFTLLQRDTGTALTFLAYLVPLYRWGLSIWVIIIPGLLGVLSFLTLLYPWGYIGVGVTLTIIISYLLLFRRKHLWLHVGILAFLWSWLGLSGFLYQKVLAPHQRQRIQVLLDPYKDPLGAGWNTIQARLAVVAGGFTGQGYGRGLQSKLDFIPQRHTDFAFCGIAEEWGWLGAVTVLGIYISLLLRITWVAENANSRFAIIYGYSLSAVLWIHLLINVAMIIGLFPVVGIPLTLISYGGSSWVAIGAGIGILQSFYRERRMRLFG